MTKEFLSGLALRAKGLISPNGFGTSNHFLDWVREQPRDKTYKYGDCGDCPVAQYCKAHLEGVKSVSGGLVDSNGIIHDSWVSFNDGSTLHLDGRFESWANWCEQGVPDPVTFGDLAKYIEKKMENYHV